MKFCINRQKNSKDTFFISLLNFGIRTQFFDKFINFSINSLSSKCSNPQNFLQKNFFLCPRSHDSSIFLSIGYFDSNLFTLLFSVAVKKSLMDVMYGRRKKQTNLRYVHRPDFVRWWHFKLFVITWLITERWCEWGHNAWIILEWERETRIKRWEMISTKQVSLNLSWAPISMIFYCIINLKFFFIPEMKFISLLMPISIFRSKCWGDTEKKLRSDRKRKK